MYGRSDLLATSEVRWFGPGNPPRAALDWFLGLDPRFEHRVDTYQASDGTELGVKRRDGGPLEVKALQLRDPKPTVFGALAAPVEDWLKWRPDRPSEMAWGTGLEVEKAVLTGDFVEEATGAGCEVELAVVEIGGWEAWTLAFEARGPRTARRRWLTQTATRLVGDAPAELAASLTEALSYPEWLGAVTVGRDVSVAGKRSRTAIAAPSRR